MSTKTNQNLDFEIIIDKYRNSLYKVAATFESDPDLLQDLHQEILFAIWKSLPGFKNKSSVHTFIYRIAYNQALIHVAKANKVNKHHKSNDELDLIPNNTVSQPDQYASSQQDSQKLISLIRQLPVMKRQLITLSLEGFSYKEIAEITGLNSNNVAVQLNRSKNQLKKIIEKEYAK